MCEPIVVHIDPDLEELVPGFLENRQKDIVAIRAALEAGDYETIRIIGHSMKGAGGGYGFDPVTDYGAGLEQASRAADAGAIRTTVDALEQYLSRVQVVFDG